MRATKKLEKSFLLPEMNLAFYGMFFLSTEINFFFLKIGNNYRMRALGIFGNAPKSNARAHLKQKKNIVALESYKFVAL